MKRRYRIGVIGAGARGETFARELYRGTPRAELAAICDIDADRLEKFCDYCELTNARRFTDPDAFLADPDMDAVVVTTPEFTHAQVACAALAAGKHVYLEKPIAHTLDDCRRIVEAHRQSDRTVFVGFNLRASPTRIKLKQIVTEGVLGQIVHVEGIEHLSQAHGAAFMRRFHRHSRNSGGLLNHKCSHDLDILLWLVGHEHRVTKIASFGGTNVFTPDRKPADYCHQCPTEVYTRCPYKAGPGFVFPVRGDAPIYHRDNQTYGGDLCVYNDDKDIVDNQTVILEWEHGVRGSFSLQMFGHKGVRCTRVWGEKGYAELDESSGSMVRVVDADTGDVTEHKFQPRSGGHGGSDPRMLERFIHAIENGGASDSGVEAGVAASVVAINADESRLSGQVVDLTAADDALAVPALR